MFHVLNLQTLSWSDWRKAHFPKYDDFASHFIHRIGVLYVFGGFKNGSKSNELMAIDVNCKSNRVLSEDCGDPEKDNIRPRRRVGTRMVCREDASAMQLYLFGGLDTENATLNDMWMYDLTDNQWTQIEQKGNIPRPRSSHSFNLYEGRIYMFGGLLEVTKESSELFSFDIETSTWTLLKSKEMDQS